MRRHPEPPRVFPSLVVAVAALVAGIAALAFAGCPAADPCAADVLYTGGGTDEVYATMLDAKSRATSDPQGPAITAPTADEKLPAATPASFTWTSPIHVASLFPRVAPHVRHTPSLFDRLTSVVIPSAYAHEPPVSSDVYLVEIAVPGAQCPVTVVTTDLDVTLDAAHWQELTAAAGKDLTLSITSAYLQVGRVQEGPYKADPVTFQVTP